MSIDPIIVSYVVAASLLTVTPGVDTALVLRTAISESSRNAAMAALGIIIGVLFWGILVSVGVGAVIMSHEVARVGITSLGALYLAWLGVKLWRSPRRSFEYEEDRPTTASVPENWFARGLATNLLNPKVAVFYVTFLPQFVPPDAHAPTYMMMLAVIHAFLGVCWFVLLIAAAGKFARRLRTPGVISFLDRLLGTLLIVVALRLLIDAIL